MKLRSVFVGSECLVISLQLSAQNLVPNGSFEEYESCPEPGDLCDLEIASDWYYPTTSTIQFYHDCNCPNDCCPPVGLEAGDGLIILWTYSAGERREYAGVRLNQALLEDSIYRFSVRLRPSNSNVVKIGSFGAYFSNDSAVDLSIDHHLIGLTPQLQRDPNNLMSDASVWYLWEDTLTASGGEEYMIIGNFLPDSLTPYTQPTWFPDALYYVDDISLIQIPKPKPDGVNELKVRFGVSPNPASSTVRVNYTGNLRPEMLKLYTITGKEVKSSPWQRDLDVSDLPSGTYLLQLEFENGAIGVERLVVSH